MNIGNKPMIMLIDDQDEHLNKIREIVKDKYEIVHVSSEQDAISLYDLLYLKLRLVILNLSMSNCSGLDLLKTLRNKSVATEFIVFSYQEDLQQAIEAMKTGAYEYLVLPLDKDELKISIHQVFESVDMIRQIEEYAHINFLNQFAVEDKLSYFKNMIQQKRGEGKVLSLDDLMEFFSDEEEMKSYLENNEQDQSKDKLPTVLVIEDEPIWRKQLDRFLQHDYNVLLAEDGTSGLNILKNEAIDVVLLDIYLPDIKGTDILPQIKEFDSSIEVIIVTAYKDLEIAMNTMKNGACDFLNKPYSKIDLQTTVAKALQKKYLKNFLPEFHKRFIQNNVSYRCKMTMLSDLITQRAKNEKAVFMKDVYLFFPELKDVGAHESTALKTNLDEEGIIALIEVLQARVK